MAVHHNLNYEDKTVNSYLETVCIERKIKASISSQHILAGYSSIEVLLFH